MPAIKGPPFGDILYGTLADDDVDGGDGNDMLVHSRGNDRFDGGDYEGYERARSFGVALTSCATPARITCRVPRMSSTSPPAAQRHRRVGRRRVGRADGRWMATRSK